MGKLIDGTWTDQSIPTNDTGHFIREETKFRGSVTADGSSGFRAESGRYHLYVSLACPWAHRTLVYEPASSVKCLPKQPGQMPCENDTFARRVT